MTSLKNTTKPKNETILTIGAHNDDYIIGVGGTLAKYAKEGKDCYSIIFSYGELSHPLFKEKVTISMRVKESQKADKILGGKGVTYLAIKEGSFLEHKMKIKKMISRIIKEKNPSKIFTHSMEDAHPDHRAVNKIVLEVIKDIKFKNEVYSFDIWNPWSRKKSDTPQLVVDISNTFKKKVDAFKIHKSQKMALISLMWTVYIKAWYNGFLNKKHYCEVFNKIQ